jgi:hypothetical protein
VDVTDKQRADIEEKLQKKKTKTFTRQILYDYRLYPQLYKLAHELYKIWFGAKDVHFNDIPKNEPANVHKIGLYIVEHRKHFYKAQYPTCLANDGLEDIDISNEQDQIGFAAELESAHFLTQASVLKHFKCKWGQSLPNIMKPMINDKAPLALLLFSDDIPEYIWSGRGFRHLADTRSSRLLHLFKAECTTVPDFCLHV